MNRTAKTVRLLQVVAAVATFALLLWTLGAPSFRFAEAANLTDVSNTLSDSDPSVQSNHEIAFTMPNPGPGIDAAGEQIQITFPSGFNLSTSSVAFGDVDIEINTTDGTVVDGLTPAANQWGFDITGQVLTLESGGGTAIATATDNVVIKIGTNADGGGNQVTNHNATGSYEFTIDIAAGQDTGSTRVAIIDNVDVSASVDTVFTFAIAGVASGQAVNGTTTTGASTATAIQFGTLSAGNSTTSAQDLTITTNATQGYAVTVVSDQELMSSTGADINGFVDGSYTQTPTAWSAPAGTLGNDQTYGHWGITSDDATTTRANDFGSDEWVSPSTTPVIVMSHDGPVNGAGVGEGTTRVGYQIEITSLQEAGDDYQTTLTYFATPVF